MKVSSIEIAKNLKKKILGKSFFINGVSSLKNLKKNTLVFLDKAKINSLLIKKINTKNSILYITNYNFKKIKNNAFIFTKNPRLDYQKILDYFFIKKIIPKKIHQSVKIGSNSIIYDNVEIEKNVTIGSNVIIYGKTIIKENTVIDDGCVIGSQGFAPIHKNKKIIRKLTSIGKLIIGKNVHIGPMTNIDVGTIDNTIISDNVFVDAMVMIGHNCLIKPNCCITAGSVLCGGSIIESNTWVGANSTIKENIKVAKNNIIGISSSVVKNTKENSIYAGNPAKFLKINKK